MSEEEFKDGNETPAESDAMSLESGEEEGGATRSDSPKIVFSNGFEVDDICLAGNDVLTVHVCPLVRSRGV